MGIARDRGRSTETLAAAYLELVGIPVVARNERIGGVEVDLVGREGDTHVLVEVKFRSRSDYGGAVHAVGGLQRSRLKRAALALQRGGARVRIDVVALDLEPDGLRLCHIRNAVTDEG